MSFTPGKLSRTRTETRSRAKDDVRRVMQAVDKVCVLKFTEKLVKIHCEILDFFIRSFDLTIFFGFSGSPVGKTMGYNFRYNHEDHEVGTIDTI